MINCSAAPFLTYMASKSRPTATRPRSAFENQWELDDPELPISVSEEYYILAGRPHAAWFDLASRPVLALVPLLTETAASAVSAVERPVRRLRLRDSNTYREVRLAPDVVSDCVHR